MRLAWQAIVAVSLSLSGCVLRGGPKAAKAPQPPPKPAPTTTSAAPEGPLSIPQTRWNCRRRSP